MCMFILGGGDTALRWRGEDVAWRAPAGGNALPNDVLPRSLRHVLEENIGQLADAWERLNPVGE